MKLIQALKMLLTRKSSTESVPEEKKVEIPLGNGKAVFLSDMTDEEFAIWEEDQVHGWAKFKKKVFNIKTTKND